MWKISSNEIPLPTNYVPNIQWLLLLLMKRHIMVGTLVKQTNYYVVSHWIQKKCQHLVWKKKKKNLQIEQLLFWPTCQHSLYIPNTWLLQILQVHKCTKSMLWYESVHFYVILRVILSPRSFQIPNLKKELFCQFSTCEVHL